MAEERLGGSRWLFSWLRQKVKDRSDSDVKSACEVCLPSIRATYSSLSVSLTTFGLRVLGIDDINMASTTWNNVGTSCSFNGILAQGKPRAAIFSGSRSKQVCASSS